MSTSFPFLKIARENGVPYGDVIRVAQMCEDQWVGDSAHLLKVPSEVREQIVNAVIEEKLRRG